eukprot:TRINITY_DN2371_c0_g1_i3.p1 TRINITY_DN2371_c0_g1~~TRINITY_DN2371_c0_g1_i3.p1  ORF type:complete len:476 (-),score=134.93 TRINITY_DN2371_c0_g1_i3:2020-3408(-)
MRLGCGPAAAALSALVAAVGYCGSCTAFLTPAAQCSTVTRARHVNSRPVLCSTSTSKASSSGVGEGYTHEGMPAGIDEVASQALEGLAAAVSSGQKRLKVDIFVPGLNPKLEGSAPYNAGLLLAFVKSLLPALDACANIKLLFSSAGDAAMAQKTFGDMGWRLPEGTRFASLSPGSVTAEDGAIVIVNPRNSVGDPVILDVEKVALKAPQATIVLVNPDLGEKVALGIIERDRRSALLASFRQAYYFRNLFYMRRPDMVPVERGCLVCQWGRGWSVYVTDPNAENMGPGSLNRFMTVPVYRRRGEDPTAKNPPTFFLAERFQDEPTRDQISACVDNSGSVADKAREAEEARLAALVESPAQAREIASYAAFDGRVTPTQKLLNAVAVLEADDRRTRKARRTALDEGGRQVNFEELTRGQGLWRLTFLVKEGKKAKGSGGERSWLMQPLFLAGLNGTLQSLVL